MNDDQLDNETVAAFLDGTLPEPERARVMRVLASSPELLGDALEAAKVVAELERAQPRTLTLDRPTKARWQRRVLIATPFLVAASIAGILVLRRDNPPEVIALARSASLTTERGSGSLDRSLGPGWDQPGWTTVRGGSLEEQGVGTTVRLGARVAQLEFAAAATDSVAYVRAASALAELLSSIDGAGPVAERVRATAVPAPDVHAALVSRVREVSGSMAAFDLGVWLETVRLAGTSGRTSFLAEGGPALGALRVIREAIANDSSASALTGVLSSLDPLLQPGSHSPEATFARVDSAVSAIPR